MPAQKRAGKCLRVPNATTRKLTALCLDMEDKLDQAADVARSMHLMGDGLKLSAADAEESSAIAAIAASPANGSTPCGGLGAICASSPWGSR